MPLSRTLIEWCFMPVQTREDRFANLASAAVTESAAGVLTYAELLTGISIGAGIGMLFDRVSYQFGITTIGLLIAANDAIQAGWFSGKEASSFDYNDRRLIDSVILQVGPVVGTPASAANPIRQPLVHDFSPPVIVASPRIYLGIQGSALASAGDVISRLFFRYQPLSDKEYLELAEAFVLMG